MKGKKTAARRHWGDWGGEEELETLRFPEGFLWYGQVIGENRLDS
jgi:hypothetical protein